MTDRIETNPSLGATQRPTDVLVQSAARALRPAVITIDGPAASGKSTAGYLLAEALNYLFVDTGILYRAVTWAALARGIDFRDTSALGGLAEQIRIDIVASSPHTHDGHAYAIFVEGEDVTEQIRTPQIDHYVSTVSAQNRVRRALSLQQRRIGEKYGSGLAEKPGIVMVGRDIGTVVMPNAAVKIYMDASVEERARRRYRELRSDGKTVDLAQIREEIVRRDKLDSERVTSPLRIAEGAWIVDTTKLSPVQVLARILTLITTVVQRQS